MSERARQITGAAVRGDGAGKDARGRATGAVADEGAARAAKARRNAWLLGAVALFFYVGYMAWMVIRASSGG